LSENFQYIGITGYQKKNRGNIGNGEQIG